MKTSPPRRRALAALLDGLVLSGLPFPTRAAAAPAANPAVIQRQMEAAQSRLRASQARSSETRSRLDAARSQAAAARAEWKRLAAELRSSRQEVAGLRQELAQARARLHRLEQVLAASRADLARRRRLLGEELRLTYESGPVSWLDVLLGARDFFDFATRPDALARVARADVDLPRQVQAESRRADAEAAAGGPGGGAGLAGGVGRGEAGHPRRASAGGLRQLPAGGGPAAGRLRRAGEGEPGRPGRTGAPGATVRDGVRSPAGRPARGLLARRGRLRCGRYGRRGRQPGHRPFLAARLLCGDAPFRRELRPHPQAGADAHRHGPGRPGGDAGPRGGSGRRLLHRLDERLGNTVLLVHGNALSTLSAHLSAVLVRQGEAVQVGPVIGRVGETGRATGPHLHFEVRVDGVPQDPRKYVGWRGAAGAARLIRSGAGAPCGARTARRRGRRRSRRGW
ncbi:MAG: peptidoglycan DD-metalloendopeptidase family protein [Firmicutes bacterium]|nr:peptidoglycan DD-metalloendopeptidase family protein [Bacillota bacterium]